MTTELSPALVRLVEREARVVAKTLAVDLLTDLIGYGHIGLLEAKARFEPRHGVNFESFAVYRIRGAIYDGVRDSGMMSRRAYHRLRRAALEHEVIGEPVGSGPDGPTRADDAQVVFSQISRLATMHLVQAAAEASSELAESVERRVDLNRLREAIARLADADRALLEAVYDLNGAGDSSADLARRLGLSRSAVSRRHRRALDRLKRLMGAPPDP